MTGLSATPEERPSGAAPGEACAAAGRCGGDGPVAVAQALCDAAALEERGTAVLFDVLLWGRPARAFALRFDGAVVAYVNRCAHVPSELDWQPGRFLDRDRRWIVCAVHGATYEPADGRCVGGPCGRGRLLPIGTEERDGKVYWYPSAQIRAIAARPSESSR